jgi:nucleoside-diphosphate-sugar epimerase
MILITGANGFIGRHVVQHFAKAQPNSPIRALLSRTNEDFATCFPKVERFCGDLSEPLTIQAALEGVETVIHLASKNIDQDGSGFDRVNVEGTKWLCHNAVQAGVRRFIYISSVGVYGHGSHCDADETTPVSPDTPFSHSKAKAENIILDHHQKGDFQAIILRHRFLYGKQDEHLMPRFIKAARSYPFWISSGRAKMSLLLVEDFAEVIGQLATLSFSGHQDRNDTEKPIYHATDGMPLSYRQMISTICELFDYQQPRFSIPFWLLHSPLRFYERIRGIDPEVTSSSISSIRLKFVAQDNFFSNKKLCHLLPEMKFTPFKQGMKKSFDYYSNFR